MNLTVNTHDGFSHIMEYDHPVTAETVIRDFPEPIRYEILSCRIDHFTTALDEMINNDCTLDLLDLRDSSANMTYQASLTLLYLKAVHDVLGKDIRVTVANSLSKGLFTTIHTGGLSEDTAEKIQADMQRIVNANLPIHRTTMNRRALMRKLKDNNNPKMKKLVENAADLDSADLCRIDDEEGFFYHIMVPSTGYLKWFEVRRYKNGFLLRFPHSSQPQSPWICTP
ncbi:MAG: hypothetical protein EOM64_01440 [Erysipelotrichia bacterium]|nr:hypothetical protein [Erysipelotrichia bacterium]